MAFLVRRLVQAAVLVAIAATLTFTLLHLAPGDPYTRMAMDSRIPPETRARLRAEQGLDRSVPVQFAFYIRNVARGDLGWSFSQHRPVRDALADAVPNTLLLMGAATLASFLLGMALGVFQARRRGRLSDRLASGISLFFYAVPDFWLALMAILLFALWIPLLPAGGMTSELHDLMGPGARLADRLAHLVLPVLTLTLLTSAGIARFQRAAMLDVEHADFVRTARAKGVDEGRIVRHHVFRNALLPVITLFGLAVPALLGGAAFVETVFAWPGMGYLAVAAVESRDYPLATAAAVAAAALVALGSLAADLLTAAADPRTRPA